jgi:hypothetical protein
MSATDPHAQRPPTIVWVHPGQPAGASAGIECVDLPTAMRRAATAAPRSFSMMLGPGALAAALAEPPDADILGPLRRAHRVMICDRSPHQAVAGLVGRQRIGLLPPPFDIETFASALAWLARS